MATEALARHGFEVQEPVKGTGGARLKATRDGETVLVLVRTSTDRWVGWMRDAKGRLKGLDEADLVVVAALDNPAKPDAVEVLAFAPEVVLEAFEANIAARKAHGGSLSASSPVFVCLDETRKEKPASVGGNLKQHALWSETVSAGVEDLSQAEHDMIPVDDDDDLDDLDGDDDYDDEDAEDYGKMDLEAFLEDVKAELAARLNVPVKKVSLKVKLKV